MTYQDFNYELESFAKRIRNQQNPMETQAENRHVSGEWTPRIYSQDGGENRGAGEAFHVRRHVSGGDSDPGWKDFRHRQAFSSPPKIKKFWNDNWHIIIIACCIIWSSLRIGALLGKHFPF